MSVAEKLITLEEYEQMPDLGYPTELVRGRIVEVNRPNSKHGQICGEIYHLLRLYLKGKNIGRAACNDSGVITERNPDTVRGPDVAYHSIKDLPQGNFPDSYVQSIPEIVFEVRSPNDRWPDVLAKVVEYLQAGAKLVAVVDPSSETIHVQGQEPGETVLAIDDFFTCEEILPGFKFQVRELFEIE